MTTQPTWIAKFAYSPCAMRLLALLADGREQSTYDLAFAAGYTTRTVQITLNALRRLGRVSGRLTTRDTGLWRIPG